MKARTSIFIFLLTMASSAYSQHLTFAKSIVDTLSSPYFSGRGYTKGGDSLSAEFIKKQCLKYTDKVQLQPFNISTNTIIGEILFKADDVELRPGIDYYSAAFSASARGKFPIRYLNKSIINDAKKYSDFLTNDHGEHIIVIDTFGAENPKFGELLPHIINENLYQARGMAVLCEKLPVYTPGRRQADFFVIHTKRELFPSGADSVELHINSQFQEKYTTHNIIAKLPGKSDSAVVFSAHYDHVGIMGDAVYFPGANDNASGVAAVLTLLKYFSDKDRPYTLQFMFFSGEEIGLRGSLYYAEHPLFDLSKIKFLINLDMVGSGSKGIQVVNGSVYKEQFERLRAINEKDSLLTQVKIRGAAANSDHYPFYAKGVPSFFIYTLGNYKEYHNIYDKADGLPMTAFDDLMKLLIRFSEDL